ncbi:MAG: hypothetical protein LBB05_02830 [Puniceicoccales bacterium]|jgi:hypothetical protein|nr:hypothetical protein [Puniceicoccales bacterium]
MDVRNLNTSLAPTLCHQALALFTRLSNNFLNEQKSEMTKIIMAGCGLIFSLYLLLRFMFKNKIAYLQ